jgi:putative flippase GtrA
MSKQLLRFSMVGILNFTVDLLVFTVLNSIFKLDYLLCQALGYTAGLINSFVLNKFWTFNDKTINKQTTAQLAKFILVNLFTLSITLIVMKILVANLSLNVFLAKIFIPAVSSVLNFFGYKLLAFNEKNIFKRQTVHI